jgi:hypothetical protein
MYTNLNYGNLIPGGEPYQEPQAQDQKNGWFLKTLETINTGLEVFGKNNQPVDSPGISRRTNNTPILVGAGILVVVIVVLILVLRKS